MLENPVTGEALRVLESTPGVFKVQYSLRPHGEIAGAHFHPGKEQQITVLSGEMHLRIDGAHQVIRAGESAWVPAGAHHFQWNPCDSEVVAIEEIRPAGRLHEFFSVLFGLARDGKTDSHGRPSLLLAAALFSEFKGSIRQAPLGTRLLLDGLAPIAALLGYRRQLDHYRISGDGR
jgi:quercetin dioxygenase-like cupin family protein